MVYTYDNLGNVASITDNRASETLNFAYDHLDRMIEVTGAITRTYAYSKVGNITDFNGTSYNYDDEDHVHAVTSAGSGTYSYDANGNMTLRATGGVTQTLTYDYENRLTEVDDGTNTVTFAYDGNGQRVKKTENGVTTIYIGNYYEILDPGGANEEVTKYYYASGKRIAMREGDALYWIHSEHLGSTVVVTDDQDPGEEVGRQKYYPYGSDRGQSGSIPTDYLFTGQKWDNPIGLYFYNARYYDPALGRFIQADTIVSDPMNPQQFNRYSYVLNSPLRYTDPSGYFTPEELIEWGVYTEEELKYLEENEPQWFAILMEAELGDVLWFGGGADVPLGWGTFKLIDGELVIHGAVEYWDGEIQSYWKTSPISVKGWGRYFYQGGHAPQRYGLVARFPSGEHFRGLRQLADPFTLGPGPLSPDVEEQLIVSVNPLIQVYLGLPPQIQWVVQIVPTGYAVLYDTTFNTGQYNLRPPARSIVDVLRRHGEFYTRHPLHWWDVIGCP